MSPEEHGTLTSAKMLLSKLRKQPSPAVAHDAANLENLLATKPFDATRVKEMVASIKGALALESTKLTRTHSPDGERPSTATPVAFKAPLREWRSSPEFRAAVEAQKARLRKSTAAIDSGDPIPPST
ncbi:hypothetical protein SAMN04488498_12382 [Mesorhizobium albiziae]|uniref:Uncharacterized protein n=1 Tax=Neomesorhizobium albiziae TaxID=335020 RepID=A0A1I4E963_9HYPH|nr:hypothetical protein [Mesorhizobium albiziae]GLS33794.1 hypothetical protein GCM10007937_55070 [Mesorhizobium albiziae]SFL01823.1 hypothetical protein SAMN04488498_12382 [Mesorhizobium albiziae]